MIWRVKGDSCRGYGFTYDNDNRLLNAKYGVWSGSNWTSEADRYSTNLTYDHNGNILTMKQNGVNGASGSTPTYGLMDDMKYFYNGNKLIGINDRVKNVTFGVGIPHDFNDGQTDIADATANNNANITETDAEYTYDLNGNLTYDKNKGMTVSYGDVPNIFNLPQRVSFGYNNRVEYDYAADGQKLRKRLYQGNVIQTTTDYLGEFVYTNGAIDFLHHEEGRCVKTATSWQYQYNLKDHLGNVRVVFDDAGNKIQAEHYYPFGGRMGGLSYSNSSNNKFLYNGKELQDEAPAGIAFDWYDYGARYYDPQIGRWHSVDPLAELAMDWTPYRYGFNNPISNTDPTGMFELSQHERDLMGKFGMMETYDFGGGGDGSKNEAPADKTPIYKDAKGRSYTKGKTHYTDGGSWTEANYLDASGPGKNVPGGKWDFWGVGSVEYIGKAMGGTNFIGPGPDIDPRGLGLRPVDEVDRGAYYHDISYYQNKVGGYKGATKDLNVRFADADLVYVALDVMNRFLAGGGAIDNVTGLPISQRTYNLAKAVYSFFAPIVIEKFRQSGVPDYTFPLPTR